MIPVLIAQASRRLVPGMSAQPLPAAGGSSPPPAPGVRGPDPAPSSTGKAGRAKPPAAAAQVLPSPTPGEERSQQTFPARPPPKGTEPGPPCSPSPGSPIAPTCPRLPGAAEGPGGAGLDAQWAPLAVRVAHEADLSLHHGRVEEAGALHGRAERAPAWARRPRETMALSRRLPSLRLQWSSALAGGCAGANGTGREEGPAGIARRIPQHPPSPIPPAGTRGCRSQAKQAKGGPGPQTSPNIGTAGHNARLRPRSHLPRSLPRSAEPPPFLPVPKHSSDDRG